MKGQWFLISAVIASAAFVAISVIFRGYFAVDPAEVARMDEDFHFNNIKNQLELLLADCGNFEINYEEFVSFARKEMSGAGYYLFINRTGICPNTQFGLLLASERAVFYDGVSPDDVLVSP